MSTKREKGDSLLRIVAMLCSIAMVALGGILMLEFEIQALSMGFLLVIASGTDPLKILDRWRNKDEK